VPNVAYIDKGPSMSTRALLGLMFEGASEFNTILGVPELGSLLS
jgi:hypothetical protein